MKRSVLAVVLLFALVFLGACSGSLDAPEKSVKKSLESYAADTGLRYKDVTYHTVEKDEAYATVRVTGKFMQGSGSTKWVDGQALFECRKVGNEWQTPMQQMGFVDLWAKW